MIFQQEFGEFIRAGVMFWTKYNRIWDVRIFIYRLRMKIIYGRNNWIKEWRNHFHLFILAIEDLWCKDESWLWKASSKNQCSVARPSLKNRYDINFGKMRRARDVCFCQHTNMVTLRGPAYLKTAFPTNHQNLWKNDVILDCSLSKPYMQSKLITWKIHYDKWKAI